MAKITIEIEDESGQVGINTTITGYDNDSNAVKMTERILMFVDRIAERQGKPKLIQAGDEAVKRLQLQHLASESVITHAH